MSAPLYCFIALDDPHNTPLIYAQIVQDEITKSVGKGGSLTRFNPEPNRRQKLIDFMRLRPESMCIVIGPTELVTERFTIFYKFTETWMNVSRGQLNLLCEYELHRGSVGDPS
jgi:hypothetical protein